MPSHSKKADLDHCLAQWHLKLEKVYKNDCDEGLTYVRLLGVIPLTPAMIDNWCITLEDGQAMINVLLNIPSFDLANKAPVLHPTHKAAAHLPSPSVDVNSLTSVLLLQTLTQSSLLTSQQVASQTPAVPCTPTHDQAAIVSSPPIPSPSQSKMCICTPSITGWLAQLHYEVICGWL
ncbi:hypothetical protein BKA83DRAFT_4123865 [Pisolithus microcarpus]|nr:hypothetical protein BKA83DRAFT_4123865 [Pisolithus microcarpus]